MDMVCSWELEIDPVQKGDRWYKDRNYGYIEDVSDGGLYLALLSFWYLYSFISELSSSLKLFILADQIL